MEQNEKNKDLPNVSSLLNIVDGTIRRLQTIQKSSKSSKSSTISEFRHLSYSSNSKVINQKANHVYAQIQKI